MARTSKASEWEIPEPTSSAADPWLTPGQRPTAAVSPLGCHACGVRLNVLDAFAKDGDLYCANCRPAGAVSSAQLPPDPMLDPHARSAVELGASRRRGWSWLGMLLEILFD